MLAAKALWPPLTVAAVGLAGIGVGLVTDTSITIVGEVVALFGIADTNGRYRDYKYLKRQSYLTPRLVAFYGKSYCGRAVVKALKPSAVYQYRKAGYKPWHILPEGFPGVLLSCRFWRALSAGHRR